MEELVDWRFLFLLNRVSPGPSIYIRVRDLELRFPVHPVVPELPTARCCSTGGGAPFGEGQDCESGEHEKQRQLSWGTNKEWLSPHRFVSTFIRRVINIRQPMRLRHLRPGGRPGLCVAEILRDQHYLLEWQVPLRYLLEPAGHSAPFVAGADSESVPSLVWPLPPYGLLEGNSLADLARNSWYEGRSTIYSVVGDDQAGPFMHAPEIDAEYDDRLFYNVLDRGSAFATLLSPLSCGTTAVAIAVGAALVAVATASATAALTTAAAATATLAARHSRIFRVDLHVIERDEHEDDQEEVTERETSPALHASGLSGSRAAASAMAPASTYDHQRQIAGEAVTGGQGQSRDCMSAAVLRQPAGRAGSYLGPVLPYIQRLLPARIGRILRSSTLASLALTEASLALATTVLATLSRDAITTASATLAAAGAAFVAVVLSPGEAMCVAAGDNQQHGSPRSWMRAARKQRLRHGAGPMAAPLGLQPNVQVKAKAGPLPEQPATARPGVQPLRRPTVEKIRSQQEQLRQQRVRELRRCGTSKDSALFDPSPAAASELRRSQSLPASTGQLGTLPQHSSCLMPPTVARSGARGGDITVTEFTDGTRPFIHNGLREGTDASSLLRLPPQRRTSFWRWPGQTCAGRFWSPREAERAEGSCSYHEHARAPGGSGPGVVSSQTAQASEEILGVPPLGWPLEGAPSQSGRGLLLFVRTYLPPASVLVCPHGIVGCCADAVVWDAVAAASSMASPEDVPLLLPTDATTSDLVRLLFLSLAQRNYMLPLVTRARTRLPTNTTHVNNATGHSRCQHDSSKKGRSRSSTRLSRRALLRFWFACTHVSGEHPVEQPLPSAKLTADLRLMSCERLSLTVLPVGLGRAKCAARSRCLTLIPCPAARQMQEGAPCCINMGGGQFGETSTPCSTPGGPSPTSGLLGRGFPSGLSPRSIWSQNSSLAVVMGTPTHGEPILVLRREAISEPVCRNAEALCLSGGQAVRPHTHVPPPLFQPEPHTRIVGTPVTHSVNVIHSPWSPFPGATQITGPFPSLEQVGSAMPTHGSQAVQRFRCPADYSLNSSAATAGTSSSVQCSEQCEGILRSEEEPSSCRPWILQSSMNTRQFEYHPQRTNVMLTGSNDGTVSARGG